MKRHAIPDMKEGNVNVTPLIDIVMCLIIFYMLVAKIGVANGVDATIKQLPKSAVGTNIADPMNVITLNVKQGGNEPSVTTLVDGSVQNVKLVDQGGKKPLVDLLAKAAKQNEQLKVVIRAEHNLPYRFIEPVLLACSEAKVREYNFETEKRKEVVAAKD